jgi:hypothetical protein
MVKYLFFPTPVAANVPEIIFVFGGDSDVRFTCLPLPELDRQ